MLHENWRLKLLLTTDRQYNNKAGLISGFSVCSFVIFKGCLTVICKSTYVTCGAFVKEIKKWKRFCHTFWDKTYWKLYFPPIS